MSPVSQIVVPPPCEGHDHRRCIDEALKMAAKLCHHRKARFTPLRRRVLELVWESHVPLGAYAILDALQERGKLARPPTVYRALDFLQKQGLIHRIESQNAYIGCVDPSRPHRGQHLICRNCGKVTELDDRAVEVTLQSGAKDKDFVLDYATVEGEGLCSDCREGEASLPLAALAKAPISVVTDRGPEPKVAPALVSASGLSLARDGLLVLDRVSLTVHEGEIVTIIGPNGSGKTTLVRALLGLIKLDEGEILKSKELRVGYVPQAFEVDPNLPLTVGRFLRLGGKKKADAHAVIELTGAGQLLDTPIQQISGGEIRRVLLARALLRKPNLLVLDEPAQGVDIVGQAALYKLINAVRRESGCAVLMISHDLRLVMAATDEVVCLNHHVCCAGHPEAVSRHPEYLALFGGEADETSFAVYTHRHDHRHDEAGNVVAFEGPEGLSHG